MSDQSNAGSAPESAPEQATAPNQTVQSPAGPPEWLGPIEDRMNELRDQNAAMAERLAAFVPQEAEEEDEYLSEAEMYDEDGELTPVAAQQIIDSRVQEIVGRHLSERDAEAALDARDDAYDELLYRIPELQDQKVVAPIVQDVAAALRADGLEKVLETPMFVELVEREYKARRYDETQTSSEDTRPGSRVVLEAAAGAAKQAEPQEDWGERIVKAAERLRPKI